MREFKISEQQAAYLISVLNEFKAKHVMPAIHLLNTLPLMLDENKIAGVNEQLPARVDS